MKPKIHIEKKPALPQSHTHFHSRLLSWPWQHHRLHICPSMRLLNGTVCLGSGFSSLLLLIFIVFSPSCCGCSGSCRLFGEAPPPSLTTVLPTLFLTPVFFPPLLLFPHCFSHFLKYFSTEAWPLWLKTQTCPKRRSTGASWNGTEQSHCPLSEAPLKPLTASTWAPAPSTRIKGAAASKFSKDKTTKIPANGCRN